MPRQRSRSPLSPILATESATVHLFFILSVLLCSVNNAGLKTETWLLYCLRLRSRSPHNAKHSTSYSASLVPSFPTAYRYPVPGYRVYPRYGRPPSREITRVGGAAGNEIETRSCDVVRYPVVSTCRHY